METGKNEIRCRECRHGEKLGSTNWYFCKLKRTLHTAFYWCRDAILMEWPPKRKRRRRNHGK